MYNIKTSRIFQTLEFNISDTVIEKKNLGESRRIQWMNGWEHAEREKEREKDEEKKKEREMKREKEREEEEEVGV